MWLAVGELSLVEALLPASLGGNQRLERIKAQVDWAQVNSALVEALPGSMCRAPTGRPAYPPLVQLKALPLQSSRYPCRSCWTAGIPAVGS